jgi:hypothetical protein
MYLEAEVYGLLNWGFAIVMVFNYFFSFPADTTQ